MYTTYDLMTRDLVTLRETDALDDAERQLELRHIRHLPVVRDGKLLGLVTPRELIRACVHAREGRKVTVGDVMLHDVVTINARTSLREAVKTMLVQQIGCLPVVDDDGTLVGIITEADFLRFADARVEELDRREQASGYEADG